MPNLEIVFVNYFNENFLLDGIQVDFYNFGTNNLVETAVIGSVIPDAGIIFANNLQYNSLYTLQFTGLGSPSGSQYLAISDQDLLTCAVFYYNQSQNAPFITFSSSDVIVVPPGSLMTIPVDNSAGFGTNSYILVSGINAVFLAQIVGSGTEYLTMVVTSILAGAAGNLLNSNSIVSQFEIDSLRGPQGLPSTVGGPPGPQGESSTVPGPEGPAGESTGATVTAAPVQLVPPGTLIAVPIESGTAFASGTYISVSNNATDSFTALITSGGLTNELNVIVQSIVSGNLGDYLATGSTVSFAGATGFGAQGAQGIPGMNSTVPGPSGASGNGSTYTTQTITMPLTGASVIVPIEDNTAFPLFSYAIISDNVSNAFAGQITATQSTSSFTILNQTIIAGTATNLISSGATVSFSGAASQIVGPQGIQGNSIVGPIGSPGHGTSNVIGTVEISPLNQVTQIAVTDSVGFPVLSYIMLTDGIYAVIYQVVAQSVSSNPQTLNIRAKSILSGYPGLTMINPEICYSGIPGPSGTNQLGNLGTSFLQDKVINVSLASDGISNVSAFPGINCILPGLPLTNYRVVVELTCTVTTNDIVGAGNPNVVLGISSSTPLASNQGQTFAGNGIPILNSSQVVADGIVVPNSGVASAIKYIGTYGPNQQLNFGLLASGYQEGITYTINGIINFVAFAYYPYPTGLLAG